MKLSSGLTLMLMAGASAFGASEYTAITNSSIDLTTTGNHWITASTDNGYYGAIACTVTSAVAGGYGNTYLTVNVNGTNTNYNLYGTYPSGWHTDILPYAGGTGGTSVGDRFVLVFPHLFYGSTYGWTVSVTTVGSISGALSCSALYTVSI
jgi:hypothetical protein